MAPGSRPDLDHARHRVAGGLQARVGRQHRAVDLRTSDEAKRDLERHSEQPFGSDEQSSQVGSVLFEAFAAKGDERPIRQDGADAQHVVGGHAVAEAMGAPGIERDVAADRADLLARRIRRVVETVRRRHRGDGQIDDPWLDDGDTGDGVEARDSIEPIERDDDAVFDWDGTAGQTGAAAARHEGHGGRVTQANRVDHFLLGLGDDDRARTAAERREAVSLVGRQCARSRQQTIGWDALRELVDERCHRVQRIASCVRD